MAAVVLSFSSRSWCTLLNLDRPASGVPLAAHLQRVHNFLTQVRGNFCALTNTQRDDGDQFTWPCLRLDVAPMGGVPPLARVRLCSPEEILTGAVFFRQGQVLLARFQGPPSPQVPLLQGLLRGQCVADFEQELRALRLACAVEPDPDVVMRHLLAGIEAESGRVTLRRQHPAEYRRLVSVLLQLSREYEQHKQRPETLASKLLLLSDALTPPAFMADEEVFAPWLSSRAFVAGLAPEASLALMACKEALSTPLGNEDVVAWAQGRAATAAAGVRPLCPTSSLARQVLRPLLWTYMVHLDPDLLDLDLLLPFLTALEERLSMAVV